MSYKELVIIDNEKISKKGNSFYCDNLEFKVSGDFKKVFNVTVIARKSKINRASQINLEKIEIASNIFSFLFNICKTFKKNIEEKLNPKYKNRFKIMLVPNITNISYGRGVGYKIEEVVLPEKIRKISATKIRKKMRKKGELK